MILTDLSKKQALDVDPKAIQKLNFAGNLELNATLLLFLEEAKVTIFDCSQGAVTVLQICFVLI